MDQQNESYTVYIHRNKVNGKVYVGLTCSPVERRWQSGWGYSSQPLFWNAIQKYGWDNFDHEVVRTGMNKDAACRLEMELIFTYKSNDRQFGYNRDNGGYAPGRVSDQTKMLLREKNTGKKMSAESRRKMSEAKKGRPMTEAEKRHLEDLHRGHPMPDHVKDMHRQRMMGNKIWLGRTVPEETREKIRQKAIGREFSEEWKQHLSEGRLGKMTGSENPISRAVLCVETGIVYETMTQAANAVKGNRNRIRESCLSEHKTSGGYHWRYIEE